MLHYIVPYIPAEHKTDLSLMLPLPNSKSPFGAGTWPVLDVTLFQISAWNRELYCTWCYISLSNVLRGTLKLNWPLSNVPLFQISAWNVKLICIIYAKTFLVFYPNVTLFQISAWNMELTWAWNISLNHNLVADMFIGNTSCYMLDFNISWWLRCIFQCAGSFTLWTEQTREIQGFD